MDYQTAVHEAGHIIGYSNWGFKTFEVTTGGQHLAKVTTIGGTDRNFFKGDNEIVALMGPEAEVMYSGDYQEYLSGAVSDWLSVFEDLPVSDEDIFRIQCDNRLYLAQQMVDESWDNIIKVADRIMNGERLLRLEAS